MASVSESQQIRDGLFLAASRTYGEQYIEPLVREYYNFSEAPTSDYDAVDSKGFKYEIKASKVLISMKNGRENRTLFDRIVFESDLPDNKRATKFKDCKRSRQIANIQNVKRDHFDHLIYVLLFQDCIKIFSAPTIDIKTGLFKNWSEKHGRYDQPGKSGQFPINSDNLDWHLTKYLKDTLSYDDAVGIYKKLSIDV